MPMVLGRKMTDEQARNERIRDFETYMERNPGAAPNGTGSTGLMSGDARGYSDLMNRQTRYLNDKNAAAGRGRMNVRDGGSMTTSRRPSLDALDDFAARSRQPYGPVTGGGIDLGRSMDLENLRGARLRNRGADASLALAESEGLPYGTPEQRTALDLKRRGAIGDFDRAEGAKNFDQRVDQKFDEFFDPRTESMHRREDERANARVSHGAGEERKTLLGRYQLDAGAEVSAAEIEARQRAEQARMEAIVDLLGAGAAASNASDGTNPIRSRAMQELDRLTGGGQQAAAGGQGSSAGDSNIVTRAEVDAYARERQRDPAQVARELQAKGYVIR